MALLMVCLFSSPTFSQFCFVFSFCDLLSLWPFSPYYFGPLMSLFFGFGGLCGGLWFAMIAGFCVEVAYF